MVLVGNLFQSKPFFIYNGLIEIHAGLVSAPQAVTEQDRDHRYSLNKHFLCKTTMNSESMLCITWV